MTALGLRINNPLNLKYRPQDKWDGLIGQQNGECEFETPQKAFRAYTIQVEHYLAAGHDTIPKIIRLWSETDQAAYTVDVLRWGHFKANQVITVNDFLAMFKGMCRQEDGADPYPDSVIQEGIDMATQKDAKPPTSFANVAAMAVTAGGGGTIGNDVANLVLGALHDIWHITPQAPTVTAITNICVAGVAFIAARFVHDKVFNQGAPGQS